MTMKRIAGKMAAYAYRDLDEFIHTCAEQGKVLKDGKEVVFLLSVMDGEIIIYHEPVDKGVTPAMLTCSIHDIQIDMADTSGLNFEPSIPSEQLDIIKSRLLNYDPS